MKLLKQFFDSGKTDLLEYKAIEKIKADLKEESKGKNYSMIELVYSQKLLHQERHQRIEYKIDNVVDFIGNTNQEVQLTQFIESRLQPFCKDPQDCINYAILNDDKQQSFMMFDKNEKHPINIFLYEGEKNANGESKNQLMIFSN